MVPLSAGKIPAGHLHCIAASETVLEVQLRVSVDRLNYTPEVILERQKLSLNEGENLLSISFNEEMPYDGYAYVTFMKNDLVSLNYSSQRLTGMLSVFNTVNPAVSNWGRQDPTEDIGVDAFEFWCPQRRPGGKNLAFGMTHGNELFSLSNIRNGIDRPYVVPNAWVADPDDAAPRIFIKWKDQQLIKSIEICFDNDYDHPMESVLMGHPENIMPFCVRHFRVYDESDNLVLNFYRSQLRNRACGLV